MPLASTSLSEHHALESSLHNCPVCREAPHASRIHLAPHLQGGCCTKKPSIPPPSNSRYPHHTASPKINDSLLGVMEDTPSRPSRRWWPKPCALPLTRRCFPPKTLPTLPSAATYPADTAPAACDALA